jgi:hypothetical protein
MKPRFVRAARTVERVVWAVVTVSSSGTGRRAAS